MHLRLLKFLTIVSLSIVCIACANIKFSAQDEDSAAKQFNVANGESNIYVYRNVGVIIDTAVSIEIDGKSAGNTDHKTFILKSVSPGNHTISAHAENTDTIDLTTEPGGNYFVWLEVRTGAVTNHAHLHSVGEEKGKKGVMESRLVE